MRNKYYFLSKGMFYNTCIVKISFLVMIQEVHKDMDSGNVNKVGLLTVTAKTASIVSRSGEEKLALRFVLFA